MMKYLLPFLFLSSIARADEGDAVHLTPQNTVIKSKFALKDGRGSLHIVVRNDGEAMGHEYLIEIRPQCSPGNFEVEQLPVENVKSTCGVNSKSLRFDAKKQTVRLLIYEPDAVDYNQQTQKNPLTAKLKCLKEAKVYTIPVDKYCRK